MTGVLLQEVSYSSYVERQATECTSSIQLGIWLVAGHLCFKH